MKLKDDFQGSGDLSLFAEEVNKLLGALNNAYVVMPSGYSGETPTIKIENGQLVLNLFDALIFSLKNVNFNESGDVGLKRKSVNVSNGVLNISVETNEPYSDEQWNFYGDYVDKIVDYSASVDGGVLTVNIDTDTI